MKRHILFIKKNCPFCVSAVDLLEEKEIEYELVDVENDLLIAHQLKRIFEWKTYPIILEQEDKLFKLIGGFSDLEATLTKDG